MNPQTEALRWLVNLGCGIGKAGGKPEPGEFEAALEAGKVALTDALPRTRLSGGPSQANKANS